MRTEVLEEMMSITDGQIVLLDTAEDGNVPRLNVTSSLSRLGTRAYFPALQDLAPQVCGGRC
jgi:F0F1-type ATP synthase alpha subunit